MRTRWRPGPHQRRDLQHCSENFTMGKRATRSSARLIKVTVHRPEHIRIQHLPWLHPVPYGCQRRASGVGVGCYVQSKWAVTVCPTNRVGIRGEHVPRGPSSWSISRQMTWPRFYVPWKTFVSLVIRELPGCRPHCCCVGLVISVFSHIRDMVHCAFSSRQLSRDDTSNLVSSPCLLHFEYYTPDGWEKFQAKGVDMGLARGVLGFPSMRVLCSCAVCSPHCHETKARWAVVNWPVHRWHVSRLRLVDVLALLCHILPAETWQQQINTQIVDDQRPSFSRRIPARPCATIVALQTALPHLAVIKKNLSYKYTRQPALLVAALLHHWELQKYTS